MIQASSKIARIDVERCVVGSMMFGTEAAELGAAELSGAEFAYPDLRTQFKGVCDLSAAGLPFDPVILAESLAKRGLLESAGGVASIAETIGAVFHSDHCGYYIQQLQTIHRRDELQRLSERLRIQAEDPTAEPGETIDAILSELEGLKAGNIQRSELISAADALAEFDRRNDDPAAVIPTGLARLDRELSGGLRAGQLIVFGGRPGTGKSALMSQVVLHSARSHRPGLICSLEMTAGEIAGRSLRTIARQRFSELPVMFSECSDFAKLVSLVRLAKRRHGIQLVCIDYLQLAESPAGKNELRERQVAIMSKGLKRLAMELKIPVLLGSQLNRESEKRGRPSLADLRESGSIEQDADIVILLSGDAESDERELIVAKHRGGPVGSVKATFDRPKFAFNCDFWTGDL